MGYVITEKFTARNRSGKVLVPQGTALHETATPEASAENENTYFSNNDVQANAHAFVDWDSIVQNVPWNEQAWGAGPTANCKFIQVELCNTADANKFNEVWKRATWLFAYIHTNIMKIPVNSDTLWSHAKISNTWHETDHQDPVDYFAQHGKTVSDFIKDVQAQVDIMQGKVAPAPTPRPINAQVVGLQNALNQMKVRDGKGNALIVDGDAGARTIEAVKRFQSICGLTVDGIAGNNTFNAINLILSRPRCSIRISAPDIVVRYIQYRVGATIDGAWGPNTANKVKIYQSNNGLSADGDVGANTWNKLLG